MRRHSLFIISCFIVCCIAMSGHVLAQESALRAEFRHEGESFRKGCGNFTLKKIPGCGEVFFTGHPLHIAVGSIAPGNGFGVGPAFVMHHTPNENWRLSGNADAIVSSNGSWRAGFYWKAIRTKIEPGSINLKPSPVLNAYLQTASLDRISYYGLGPNTTRPGQSFFGMRETIVGVTETYPVFKPLNMSLHGEINGRMVRIRGIQGPSPSIEQVYNSTNTPGLAGQSTFAQFGEGVRLRPSISEYLRLNYFVHYQQFIGGSSGFSFQRWTVDLSHQIPLSKKITTVSRDHNGPDDCSTSATSTTHDCPKVTRDREGSISLRFLLSESFTSAGHAVPFFFQPTLGGADINGASSLSSFQDYRFRAPNIMLMQGRIEHSLYGPIGMAFVAEAGKVALTRSDIGFNGLVHSYATGLTFRAGGFPMMYLMFAWGSHEGTHSAAAVNTSLLGGSSRPSLN